MSLAHAAEHLKQHGRGPDDQLVHMSSNELKGLQAVALAHGGSLTINPHTGLPEAGFLDKLLPTIIGVGLSVASGGALTPLMAAGITGAGYGLATGDLNKGLMAGLGAYGGAGLGAGLTSAGSAAAQATADTATSAAANQAAQTAGQQVATNAATQGMDTAGQEYTKQLAIEQAGNAVPRTLISAPAATDIGGNLTQAGQGFKSLSGTAGRDAFMSGMADKAPYATPALGFSAVNAASPQPKVPGAPEPDQYDKRLAGYKLASDYKAYEAPRPNPYYSAQYQNYAEGGLAMGGPAPQTNFANPSQSMMGTSQYSMATDPMSGNIAQRNMAEGGVTGSGQMQLNVPLSIGNGEAAGGGTGGPTGFGGSGSPYSPAGSGNTPPAGGGDFFNSIQRGIGGKGNMGGPQVKPEQSTLVSEVGRPDYEYYKQIGQQEFPRPQVAQRPLQQDIIGRQQIGTPPQEYDFSDGRQYGAPPVAQPPMQDISLADQGQIGMQDGVQRGIGGKGGMTGPQYAKGGLTSFAKGGHLSASAGIPDTGIYYDSDLVTRGEQALGASQAKNKQLFKRAGLKYVEGPKSGIEKLGGGFSETGAGGGLSHLGGYSDGGRMLKGPGDGMSDDIPAMIGKKQPARLADGEFVVPADVVSHLGNGSTDAGAKKLYSMMDKIRKARTGKKAQGKQINPNKFIPV
jgi:hypothetical protein